MLPLQKQVKRHYDRIFLEKYKISKKNHYLRLCNIAYTIVTLSAGETKGVKFREPEYLVFNHDKYRICSLASKGNASEWMSEENEVIVRWNGSRVDQQKLTTALTSYYHTRDHIAKMSIEQAVIDGNIEQAYYLAQKSGKSKTSDTLEGRVLQRDWQHAETLAKNRIRSSTSGCTTT